MSQLIYGFPMSLQRIELKKSYHSNTTKIKALQNNKTIINGKALKQNEIQNLKKNVFLYNTNKALTVVNKYLKYSIKKLWAQRKIETNSRQI